MNKRLGKVFIDTNIIKHAANFRLNDVFQWICELYEAIYVHQDVYEELLLGSLQNKVNQLITRGQWILFNPEDESTLTENEYAIYSSFHRDIEIAFEKLDNKKVLEGRVVKGTKNYGEISSLAACLFLGAHLICSNDHDIREVIKDEKYVVLDEEDDVEKMIVQDTLMDFCCYCVKNKIASKKEVRKFFKASLADDSKLSEKVKLLNDNLDSI